MLKLHEIERILWITVHTIPIAIAIILLMGCSTIAGQGTATEDTTYLTPIPRATLQAYQFDTPIRNKMDAVIVARLSLDTTRLSYTEEPEVVFVEEMRLEDALKRIAQPGFLRVINTYEDKSGDTKVWLVLFEGDWQMTSPPPEHPVTPEPPSHGCVYIVIDATGNRYSEFDITFGTTECSS